MREYKQGVAWDKCVKCGRIYTTDELLYEGVEPNVHSPKCKWCIVKEAQEIYGVENVELPNISKN